MAMQNERARDMCKNMLTYANFMSVPFRNVRVLVHDIVMVAHMCLLYPLPTAV